MEDIIVDISIPKDEVPLINEQIKVCTRLKPGESRALDHRLVTGNSNQPVLVRDEWHYHEGDGDRCEKIYGVATLLNPSSPQAWNMEQSRKNSQYSALEQALLGGFMEIIRVPDNPAVTRAFFPKGIPEGALNELHPFFFEGNPSTEAVEIWLPSQLRPVNTVSREVSESLYDSTRDFCQMNIKKGYRKLSHEQILVDLLEAQRSGRSMSVIRHADDIGLYTVNNDSAGISSVDWTTRSMRDGWDPQKLLQFREYAEARGYVDVHEWEAFDLTEEKKKLWLQGEIEMIYFEDTLCRVVKLHDHKVLG